MDSSRDDEGVMHVLSCPCCGHADLDFERRGEATVVRCGLCGAFVELTGTKVYPADGEHDLTMVVLEGRPYVPASPKRTKIVPK